MRIIAAIVIALLAGSCKSHEPVRIRFDQPPQSAIHWNALLPPAIDSFKVLNTGSVKVPLKGMLNTKKLPEDHGLDQFLWVDVYVFLFHHRDKGWYMIDTGLDSSFQGAGNIRGALAKNYIKESVQESGQNIAAQLRRESKMVAGIFLTHLHGDHTAGLPEIDPAIPKFLGEGERYIHYPLLYSSNHLHKKDTLRELDWSSAPSADPFNSVLDIFGDQSLFALSTPGHSEGHTSYLLNTVSGLILLTGDASHTRYGFQNAIEPGWTSDRKAAVESLRQLREFMDMYPETQIHFGHQKNE